MKKTGAVAVVGLLVAVGGVAPYFVGVQAQTIVEEFQRHVSDEYPVTFAPVGYERGWFTSSVRTLVTLEAPAQPQRHERAQTASFQVVHTVHHGPLLLGDAGPVVGWTRIVSMPEYPETVRGMLSSLFGEREPLIVETLLGIDGRARIHVAVAAADGTSPVGDRIEVSALDARATVDSNNAVTVGCDWPGFRVSGKSNLEVENVRLAANAVKDGSGIWVGTNELTVGRIKSQDGHVPSLVLDAVSVNARAGVDADGRHLNFNGALHIKQVGLKGEPAASDVEVDAKLEHLDLQGLLALREAQKGGGLQQPMEVMQPAILSLLHEGGTLEIPSFHAIVRRQPVDGRLSVTLGKNNVPALKDARQLLAAVDGKAELTVAEALLMETPAAFLLDAWVQQGFVSVEGSTVKVRAEITNGRLRVGRQLFPL